MRQPKKASSEDVARAAGVSRATVSYVLNGRTDQSIPEETRRRVLRAVQELSYRPNHLARSLQRGRTHTLGVIMPSLSRSFHARIMQGIREVCFAQDYRILLAEPGHESTSGEQIVGLLLEHQVDGLICVASESETGPEQTRRVLFGGLELALTAHLPCVVVDDRSLSATADCVITDDAHGAVLAVSHLIARGHRRVGHLSGGRALTTAGDRCAGYREALERVGLPVDEALIVGASYSEEDAVEAMTSLLGLPERPTAVFAASDYLAAVAWRTAHAHGLRVPDDLALAGYGDLEVAPALGLTTIRQRPEQIGRAAVERLLLRMRQPELDPEILVQPTELVVRPSSGV